MQVVAKTDFGEIHQLDNSNFRILHLYGETTEMGYAEGWLLAEEILQFYSEFTAYLATFFNQGEAAMATVPDEYKEVLGSPGHITADTVEAALAKAVETTRPYIPYYFMEEAEGMAKAIEDYTSQNGIKLGLQENEGYRRVLGISMFGELVRAGCSIIGANNEATDTGDVIQLRALDFDIKNPLIRYPLLKVYHPPEGGNRGHPFITLGWVGFIGAVTAYSNHNVVSEKLWANYLKDPANPNQPSANGTDSVKGIPFNFLLRDIAQFDKSLDDTRRRVHEAHRTCAIYIGVGNHQDKEFSVFEYSLDIVSEFKWDTAFPGYAPQGDAHPTITDIMYIDKDKQPSVSFAMPKSIGEQLRKNAGKLNAESVQKVCNETQTGDIHIAIFDLAANSIHIALGAETQAAYELAWDQYIHIDADSLLGFQGSS